MRHSKAGILTILCGSFVFHFLQIVVPDSRLGRASLEKRQDRTAHQAHFGKTARTENVKCGPRKTAIKPGHSFNMLANACKLALLITLWMLRDMIEKLPSYYQVKPGNRESSIALILVLARCT